jgi:hypothetical protein
MMRTKTTTRRKRRSGTSLYLMALVLVCVADAGQRGGVSPVSRTIDGSVLDQGGHPVPGAVVLIEDLKSLQVRSYLVQEDGKFQFRGLSSDANYELRAHFHGVASRPKTVSVFESSPAVVVTLTLAVKHKRGTPAPPLPGNPS